MQLLRYIGNIGGAVYILNNLKRVQILGLVHFYLNDKLQVHEMCFAASYQVVYIVWWIPCLVVTLWRRATIGYDMLRSL